MVTELKNWNNLNENKYWSNSKIKEYKNFIKYH